MKRKSTIILALSLLALGACKEANQSSLDTLEDLERGEYVSEVCSGVSDTSAIKDDRIISFGKSCDQPDLEPLQEKGCSSARKALSSLTPRQLDFLGDEQGVGMNIKIGTKSATKKYVEAAFVASQADMDNVSSFFLGEGNNLATIVRVDLLSQKRRTT